MIEGILLNLGLSTNLMSLGLLVSQAAVGAQASACKHPHPRLPASSSSSLLLLFSSLGFRVLGFGAPPPPLLKFRGSRV